MPASIIDSSCDGNCSINSITHLCEGCFRTMDEIISWFNSTDEQKKMILEKVEIRKLSALDNN